MEAKNSFRIIKKKQNNKGSGYRMIMQVKSTKSVQKKNK